MSAMARAKLRSLQRRGACLKLVDDERIARSPNPPPLINLGELIALAALIVSALGVWIAGKAAGKTKTTRVVEQRSAIPLALRGHDRW